MSSVVVRAVCETLPSALTDERVLSLVSFCVHPVIWGKASGSNLSRSFCVKMTASYVDARPKFFVLSFPRVACPLFQDSQLFTLDRRYRHHEDLYVLVLELLRGHRLLVPGAVRVIRDD